MTTAAIPATPGADPGRTRRRQRRAGLPGTLRSELTKILSVRSTYWTLLAQVVAQHRLGGHKLRGYCLARDQARASTRRKRA